MHEMYRSDAVTLAAFNPALAGAGLKHEHAQAIFSGVRAADFFEVHAENYMGDGGPPHALLTQVRASYPVSIHGVGLSADNRRVRRRHDDAVAVEERVLVGTGAAEDGDQLCEHRVRRHVGLLHDGADDRPVGPRSDRTSDRDGGQRCRDTVRRRHEDGRASLQHAVETGPDAPSWWKLPGCELGSSSAGNWSP